MITVGLDFGTHQTKVCIEEKDGAVLNYTFMKFPTADGGYSYTLPSLIGIGKDDRLSYGFLPNGYDGQIIKYFKQKTFLPNSNLMPDDDYLYYSTWFLAFILFDLEEKYGKEFSIQMGFPSDNNKEHIQKAKAIATRIMVSAYRLVEDIFVNDKQKFLATSFNNLKAKTELVPYSKEVKEEYELLAFPEAYACLKPLASQGKIDKHLNLMVDIGGGTTDISFFTIEAPKAPLFDNDIGVPQIYLFHSINYGVNYLTCADDDQNSGLINSVNVQDESQINKSRLLTYFSENEKFVDGLIRSLEKEFIEQTGSNQIWRVHNIMLKNRPIVFCGGGSYFQCLLRAYKGFSEIKQISYKDWAVKYINDIDEIIDNNLCALLSTAYGLSISVDKDNIKTKPFKDIFDGIRGSGDFKRISSKPESKPYMNPDIDY